jgi:hypothetical protein
MQQLQEADVPKRIFFKLNAMSVQNHSTTNKERKAWLPGARVLS